MNNQGNEFNTEKHSFERVNYLEWLEIQYNGTRNTI